MSNAIDMSTVAQRLAAKIADLEFQLTQYQVAAENLQKQRDDALGELEQMRRVVSGEVHTITELPEDKDATV